MEHPDVDTLRNDQRKFRYAQLFRFEPTSEGFYRASNRNATTQVWDVNAASTVNGAEVQLWAWNTGSNQEWKPVPEGDGNYHFAARHSGKCLDVPNPSLADAVQFQQYTWNGTGAQRFHLVASP